MNYSIQITLDAECNEDNISKILERGSQKGFKYYDGIGEIRPGIPSILDARTTAQRIVEAYTTKPEYGPCVHIHMPAPDDPDGYENVTLWFHKTDGGSLEFHMGAFGSPKRKELLIDFDYYIRMCLDLCQDFQIWEVKTTIDD